MSCQAIPRKTFLSSSAPRHPPRQMILTSIHPACTKIPRGSNRFKIGRLTILDIIRPSTRRPSRRHGRPALHGLGGAAFRWQV